MPFRRSHRSRYRRRRPMRRRKRYSRRPMTAYRVKRIINAELKYDLVAQNLAIPNVVGDITHLTNIALGDTQIQRTGNWIAPQIYHGNLVVKGNSAALPGTDSFLIRAGVFQWMNDAQFDPPALVQIVQNVAAPMGPLSLLNKGSFKQLWGRTFVVMNEIDNSQYVKKFSIYLKLGSRPKTLFDGGNDKKFHYYFFIMSDSIVANTPSYSLDSVLRFTDS